MLRAYKYRIYPTNEQKVLFAKTFGCCRFVYNWALNLKITAYKERKETLGNVYLTNLMKSELKADMTGLKKSTLSPCRVRYAILIQHIPISSAILRLWASLSSSHAKAGRVSFAHNIVVLTLLKEQLPYPKPKIYRLCCTVNLREQ